MVMRTIPKLAISAALGTTHLGPWTAHAASKEIQCQVAHVIAGATALERLAGKSEHHEIIKVLQDVEEGTYARYDVSPVDAYRAVHLVYQWPISDLKSSTVVTDAIKARCLQGWN